MLLERVFCGKFNASSIYLFYLQILYEHLMNMEAIDYLRGEIKSYFPESTELRLSGIAQRRFNFYFEIKPDIHFLIYLNWDGEYDRFILKCLEFTNAEILAGLIRTYPETGSKAFNSGKPKSTISFICLGENKFSVSDFKGSSSVLIESKEITGDTLMQCIDPDLLNKE